MNGYPVPAQIRSDSHKLFIWCDVAACITSIRVNIVVETQKQLMEQFSSNDYN